MNNRHYFCRRCGALKRAPAYVRLKNDAYPQQWPRCCDRLMQALDFEKAAAIVKLSAEKRIAWSIAGQHIIRGRRWGIWKPAITEREVANAGDAKRSYTKRLLGSRGNSKWVRPKGVRPNNRKP